MAMPMVMWVMLEGLSSIVMRKDGDREPVFADLFCPGHKVSLITIGGCRRAIPARVWLITDPTQRDDQTSSLAGCLVVYAFMQTI